MKTILLATPYITAMYDLGKLIGKALNDLGYSLIYWDFRLTSIPPVSNYDLAIVLKGNKTIHNYLKSPMILIFPDDPSFYGNDFFYYVAQKYDKVFTINKVPGEYEWLPLGGDKDVHCLFDSPKQFDVCFIGTVRTEKRLNLVKYLAANIKGFNVFGNGWENSGLKTNPPQYFRDLAKVISCHKIVVQEHFNLATDTKDIEVPFIGNALLISDNKQEIKEIYPCIPSYNSPEEALQLIKYYLEHEGERRDKVKEMCNIAQIFSYQNQLKKVISSITW